MTTLRAVAKNAGVDITSAGSDRPAIAALLASKDVRANGTRDDHESPHAMDLTSPDLFLSKPASSKRKQSAAGPFEPQPHPKKQPPPSKAKAKPASGAGAASAADGLESDDEKGKARGQYGEVRASFAHVYSHRWCV